MKKILTKEHKKNIAKSIKENLLNHKLDCHCCVCKGKRGEYKKENHPNWKGGKPKCIDCEKELKNIYAKRCKSCARKLQIANHKINCQCFLCRAKKGKYKEENNPFFGKKHTKRTKKRQSLSHGGTGIPYENREYPPEFTSALKEKIRKRDNHKCQNCDMTEEEHIIVCSKLLHIHHIDYDKENNNEENLITLCNWCNLRANKNRQYWQEYFKTIMREIYEKI